MTGSRGCRKRRGRSAAHSRSTQARTESNTKPITTVNSRGVCPPKKTAATMIDSSTRASPARCKNVSVALRLHIPRKDRILCG